MHLIHEMGYAAYEVRSLERAVDFFRDVCQLEVSERRGGIVYLTGDNRHHWVRLQEGPQSRLVGLGYRAASAAAVSEVATRLDRRGVAWTRTDGPDNDLTVGGLRFTAPDGVTYEVYEQMLALPASIAPDRGIACLLHAVLFIEDVAASVDFYRDVLGMLVSDRIENVITFLRCGNQYHHSLALARGGTGELDHIALLVKDIEDVLAFRAHAQLHEALAGDIVKHVASTSVSIYTQLEEESIGVEFCNGHDKIEDDSYAGRLIKAGPTTVNAWSGGFPARPEARTAQARPPAASVGGGTAAGVAAMGVDVDVEPVGVDS